MGLMHELKAAGITTLAQLKVALGLVALGPGKDFGLTGQVRPTPRGDTYIVWDAGPAAEADYTDHRYWLQIADCPDRAGNGITDKVPFKQRGNTTGYEWITATNLAERMPRTSGDAEQTGGTHLLVKGTAVRVKGVGGKSPRYVFWHVPERPVRVKITSAASGGGKYNGRILTSSTTAVAATGDLAESDLGTVPGGDNCLVLNGAEVGKATHDLTSGTPVAKVFVGMLLPQRSTGDVFVVVINGLDPETCT